MHVLCSLHVLSFIGRDIPFFFPNKITLFLQRCVEDVPAGDIYDESLDHLVPLCILLTFAKHFIESYWDMLRSLGILE